MSTTSVAEKTFEEIAADESGTVYEDGYENGVRFLIMRGPGSLCAYMGVPNDHPMAGFGYDDLPGMEVHGGLTYSSEGKAGTSWPEGWFWYGWDYSHSGDKSFYDLREDLFRRGNDDRAWTVADVRKQIWSATYDFAKLCRLSEDLLRRRSAS
jgi:hypothetical protein